MNRFRKANLVKIGKQILRHLTLMAVGAVFLLPLVDGVTLQSAAAIFDPAPIIKPLICATTQKFPLCPSAVL